MGSRLDIGHSHFGQLPGLCSSVHMPRTSPFRLLHVGPGARAKAMGSNVDIRQSERGLTGWREAKGAEIGQPPLRRAHAHTPEAVANLARHAKSRRGGNVAIRENSDRGPGLAGREIPWGRVSTLDIRTSVSCLGCVQASTCRARHPSGCPTLAPAPAPASGTPGVSPHRNGSGFAHRDGSTSRRGCSRNGSTGRHLTKSAHLTLNQLQEIDRNYLEKKSFSRVALFQ